MLHELLFSLLGFVGDVIIDDGVTYRVKDGFDLLRESERDLANRIAPLGWYYVKLSDVARNYDIVWGRTSTPRVYMASVAQAVSDLLEEYVADLSFLEQLVLCDGPIPLSQILQHLQKYLLVMPELYAILQELKRTSYSGCRLLDYFYNYNTGVPVLKEVLDRIVLRLRVVFVKQCFAWMVHGELEDPGKEFFIQAKNSTVENTASPHFGGKENDVLQNKVLSALLQASKQGGMGLSTNSTHGYGAPTSEAAFDWTTSYHLSLETIPSSHVSPRIASKVVFAGKAVKLLQSSGALLVQGSAVRRGDVYDRSEGYRYLSSGAAHAGSIDEDEVEDAEDGNTHRRVGWESTQQPSSTAAGPGEEMDNAKNPGSDRAYQEYTESGGYSVEDTQRFTELFTAVLQHPDRAVELLETAIEAVNDTISNRLWVLLRDSYGFTAFLQVIRSTYLLGRGELFQGLLDGILQLTYTKTPETLEMDNLLNWRVLRTSAKLVGLESDDALNKLLTLRVHTSEVTVRNFALHKQDLQLVGAAYEIQAQTSLPDETVRVGQQTVLELCRLRPCSHQRRFEDVWQGFLRKRVVGRNTQGLPYPADADEETESLVDSLDAASQAGSTVGGRAVAGTKCTSACSYAVGAAWLADPRAVSKGFDWSATFRCSWNDLRAQLTARHAVFHTTGGVEAGDTEASVEVEGSSNPFLKYDGKVVELGAVSCCLRGDRRIGDATRLISSSAVPAVGAGALAVGAIFYGLVLPNVSGVRYFARLFLRSAQLGAGISGTASTAGLPRRHEQISVGTLGQSVDISFAAPASSGELVLSDGIVDIDGNLAEFELGGLVQGSISSAVPLRFDVEYHRAAAREASDTATVASQRSLMSPGGGLDYSAAAASVVYTLRARLVEATAPRIQGAGPLSVRGGRGQHNAAQKWGLEVPLTLANHVKCQGGQAYLGLCATGLLSAVDTAVTGGHVSDPEESSGMFCIQVQELHVAGKGSVSNYPVTSVPTAARHPDTAARVQVEVDRVRAWMNLKLQLHFPPMFRVIFDAEAMTCYERVFALIMKVRVVAHALERLWIARSRLAADRSFCQSRHSMHFFVSNLLYYLQVDVVDSEYSTLQKDISEAADFQSVLRAHKTFTANMLRLSLIDHAAVQEGIERILHICLRFIAICRILHRSEFLDVEDADDYPSSAQTSPHKNGGLLSDAERINMLHAPIYVPPEELDFIRKDFFAQVSLLFQLMRKVESRGFIFRLDFNNYLSGLMSGAM